MTLTMISNETRTEVVLEINQRKKHLEKSTFLTTIKVIPNHNRRDDFYCGCQNHFQIYSSQQKFLKLNADKSEQICNYAHNKKEEKVLLISGVITLEDLIDMLTSGLKKGFVSNSKLLGDVSFGM